MAEFLEDLKARIATKLDICDHLLEQDRWDLFAAVFAESHCVGHQLWCLHDQEHPRYDAEMARALGDPVKRIYGALDTALGRLLARAGPETTVVVVCSHGMGPHYDATFLLDEILLRLDGVETAGVRRRLVGACESVWKRTPPVLKRLIRPLVNGARRRREARTGKREESLSEALLTPDIGRRRFFTVPNNDVHGGIRVNLAGREPQGIVQPGAEYDALYEELRRELGELVNLETGKHLVRAVVRSAEIYEGEGLDGLPDFLIEWDTSAPIRAVQSPKIGKIEREFDGIRTGDHKPEGLFVAKGPSIRPQRLAAPVSIMDVAPTVAALLGVPLPDVDGKPIRAALG